MWLSVPFRPGSYISLSLQGSAGCSMGETEVLVFGELCCSSWSRSLQSCWGLSGGFRFRQRVCNPGRRGLPLGWGIYSRRGVLAWLRGHSIRILPRDELEQGGGHCGANVPAGLGFRSGLLDISRKSWWRWPRWRGWTLLTRRHQVVPELFSF